MNVEEEFEKAVADEAKVQMELYQEAFKGYEAAPRSTYGDREFIASFLVMLNAYGPDWATALEFVPGGREELRRFTKLVGARNGTN